MTKLNYNSTLNNTDKFSGGVMNDKNIGHNYQLIYKNFLTKKSMNILEIGTANGGFVKFLHDNNFKTPNNKIIGADIKPQDKHYHVSDYTNYNHLYDNFYVGNAFSDSFFSWNNSLNIKYDLVIEDADHTYDTQKYMLENCFKLLNKTGIYICEDIHNYETAKMLLKNIPLKYKQYSYIWDGSASIDRTDDICIVIDLR
jgi:23S rRNA U2552 (ribose-2'-O)-methylase RlmE/FtsJ